MNVIIITSMYFGGTATGYLLAAFVRRIRYKNYTRSVLKLLQESIPAEVSEKDTLLKDPIAVALKNIMRQKNEIEQQLKSVHSLKDEFSSKAKAGIASLFEHLKSINSKADGAAMSLLETTQHEMSVASMSNDLKDKSENGAASLASISHSVASVTENCEKQKFIAMETREKAENSQKVFNNLRDSIITIKDITNRISSVAKKTKLLALNASIEAAAAGEAGKGFTVVANEVKLLSQESTEATEQINSHISQIHENIEHSLAGIGTILELIKNIDDLAKDIALEINEQNSGVSALVNASLESCQLASSINTTINNSVNGLMMLTENVAQISTSSINALSDAETVRIGCDQLGCSVVCD